MLLLEPAAGLACQASREGSVELFEGARCHLGSRAAILAAGQRLLPALCFVWGAGANAEFQDRCRCFSTARRLWFSRAVCKASASISVPQCIR